MEEVEKCFLEESSGEQDSRSGKNQVSNAQPICQAVFRFCVVIAGVELRTPRAGKPALGYREVSSRWAAATGQPLNEVVFQWAPPRSGVRRGGHGAGWKRGFLGAVVWACNLGKRGGHSCSAHASSGPRGPHGVGGQGCRQWPLGRGQLLAAAGPILAAGSSGGPRQAWGLPLSEQWTRLHAKHPAPAPLRGGVST